MALVYIRPDADSIDGNWVNESASNVNLYDSLNESASPFDADYIRSENNPTNDIVRLRLGNFGSVPTEPMTVRYRYKKVVSGAETLSFKVRLIQGGSPEITIAEWEHSDVDEAYVTQDQPLTTLQFEEITDFDDLYLEFEAISGALEVAPGALGLLFGEDEGFAIDATTYDSDTPAAYVGGPVGGTVATIDAGTPANDLSNVALDSSNLVQSGTSPKMVQWDSAPFVRWTPHNYCLQSQTLDNAVWTPTSGTVSANTADTVAPDGTSTADKFTLSGASNNVACSAITILAGVPYTCSVYAKAGTGANWFELGLADNSVTYVVRAWFDLSGGGATGTTTTPIGSPTVIGTTITDVGSGWFRCTVTFIGTATNVQFFLIVADTDGGHADGDSGDIQYWWGAQLNRGYVATPYIVTTSAARIGIPQAYDTYEELFGILVEPAATNLTIQSEQIDQWNLWQTSASANSATAPDGGATADTLTATTGSNSHYAYKGLSLSSGVTHTLSIFAKQTSSAHRYVQLVWAGNATTKWVGAVFDLLTETMTESAVGADGGNTYVASSISAIGDGWYRLTLTAAVADTTIFATYELVNSGTPTQGDYGAVTWNPAGTESVYLWGAQTEVGSIATSYIPTLGGTATRAVDKVSVLVSTLPYSQSEGTLFLDGNYMGSGETTPYLVDFYEGGSDDFGLYVVASGALLRAWAFSGGNYIDTTIASAITDTRVQATFATKTNLFAASADGAASSDDTSQDLPNGVTIITFGTYGDQAQSRANLLIYRFAYVPRQIEEDADTVETWRFNF